MTELNPTYSPIDPVTETSIALGDSGVSIVVESAEANPAGSNYVRFVDADGNELEYWDSAEWAEEPADVMGAIFGAMCQYLDDQRIVFKSAEERQ